MTQLLRSLILPAALVVGLGGVATLWQAEQIAPAIVGAQAAPPVVAPGPGPEGLASAFRAASQAAMPGVVYVQVEAAPRNVSSQLPEDLRGTPFEEFFRGAPRGQQRPQMGSGSGFIISPDGYVLTNNHVVERASRVTVVLTDKREFTAEVVGRDPNTDIAVLKIDAQGLPVVALGDADNLQIGDWVLALGYPLSLGETVTAGIISAKGRSIGIMQRSQDANAPIEHFIQTDAAINPGNSGGPLIDLQGRVIGVNTAIASQTGFYSGYGFAVPINLAKRVADDLIRYGAVHRPKLGIQIKDVTPADVDVFRLPDARGSVVASVPEGPAKEAGIQLGDVIVAVDGAEIKDTGELMERIARRQPGERVALEVIRYGDRKRMAVRLGAFEAEPVARTASRERTGDAVGRLGFEAAAVTPQLANQLGLSSATGVVVVRVDPTSPAPRQLEGMRIERLNGKEIHSVRDLQTAAAELKPGATVSVIGLTRDGTQTILNYRLRG
ncbi:MAG TPA: trypsin-like peptidase domain-containing protein [Longimicrobiaceae bacterium]|nr:trypsin-like peptidase domain-containing protein [Longimicrobiaceae bacterium]